MICRVKSPRNRWIDLRSTLALLVCSLLPNPTPSRQDKKDVSVEAEGGSGIVRIVNVTIVEPTSNQSCGFLDSSVTSNPFLGV